MKKFAYILFILNLSITSVYDVKGQISEVLCGTIQATPPPYFPNQGLYLTAKDTLHVLIIYAQFPDDNYDINNSNWTKNQPPIFLQTFIDSTADQNSQDGNLTHYFREVSAGKFILTGTSRFLVSPHSRQWYLDNSLKRWAIHKEIILSLDVNLDFAQFDRWRRITTTSYQPGSDGRVDMVYFVWRNVSQDLSDPEQGLIDLGFEANGKANTGIGDLGWDLNDPVINVDSGVRHIYHGFSSLGINYGAGTSVVMQSGYDGGLNQNKGPMRVQIHETAHFWLGGNNIHHGTGFWAMLEAWGARHTLDTRKIRQPNSWEREKVGWHSPVKVALSSGTLLNQTLTDYVSTNASYKISIPGTTDEYYRLEYHAKVSQFDASDNSNNNIKGLYILHQTSSSPASGLRLIPADGTWKWEVTEEYCPSYFTDGFPVYKRVSPDANGYNDCFNVPFTWSSQPLCNAPPPSGDWLINAYRDRVTNAFIEIPVYRGDGNDHFTLTTQKVFTPYSNPQAKGNIAIEIINEQSNTLTFNLYIGSAYDTLAAPANPFLISLANYSSGGNDGIKITWAANREPDIAGYEVYRQINSGSISKISGSSVITDTFFVEWGVQIASGPSTHTYYVKAVDTQNKTSNYSNGLNTAVQHVSQGGAKRGADGGETTIIPEVFELAQNFPNPFNPTTTFAFALPRQVGVRLTIFDLNGRQVAQLINEELPAGRYEIPFDASNLASGVYLYRLSAGNPSAGSGQGFSQVRKMMLIK